MKALAVIPVRYASSRLPGKPLLKAAGKYLFQHVYEKVLSAQEISHVIIATDDERIKAACAEIGAEVMMTSPDHPSGSDRVAEVAQKFEAEIIVNIQGDEPEIPPEAIDDLIKLIHNDPKAEMATLACPLLDMNSRNSQDQVKVVLDSDGKALYFSRAPIPWFRDSSASDAEILKQTLGHVGIYAYKRDFLLKLTKMPVSSLEQAEKLEQLRALEAGAKILVKITNWSGAGVDTPEDFEAFKKSCEASN